MKDALTKITFGFFLAQLFPGAILALALGLAYASWNRRTPDSLVTAVDQLLRDWSDATTAHHLFLLGLCVGLGMFIHGLNWAALGALEQGGKGSIFANQWHRWPIVLQVVTAPWRLWWEVLRLALAGSTKDASIRENVQGVSNDQMKQHEFLQEFYLYSAQFFAHSAWALTGVFLTIVVFVHSHCHMTLQRFLLLVALYLAIGTSFVLGRIQLYSLIRAETELLRVKFWTLWKA